MTTPRGRLRIVFFGTGGLLSAASLRAVATEHDILGVVRASRGGWARALAGRLARQVGLRAADPLSDLSRALHLSQWPVASMRDGRLVKRVNALRPDILCVAHFPWRIPQEILGSAAHGGINVHASLLPRHRGPLPLFWVYHADDRDTGVTIHYLTHHFDRGEIIAQRSFPLPRGYPADQLNADNARVGAELLQETVRAIASGDARGRSQDDDLATRAPFVQPGRPMVDFEMWDVERVWHFLAGVWPRFIEPLVDAQGQPVRYAGVLGYERGAALSVRPGLARPLDAETFALQCRGGVVLLRRSR